MGAADMPVAERLLRGARMLGDLWRKGQRCKSSWSSNCACASAQTDFCKAKCHWLKLLVKAIEQGAERDIPDGDSDFGVIEAMLCSELDAAGLVARINFADGNEWRVGPNADCPLDVFVRLAHPEDASRPVADLGVLHGVMKGFPGAKIVDEIPPDAPGNP